MQKRLLVLLQFLLGYSAVFSQYYLRGDIKDEKGRPLTGVAIYPYSRIKLPVYSGAGGSFGVPVPVTSDSVLFVFNGYEQVVKRLETVKFQSITMRMTQATLSTMKNKLASVTKNLTATQNVNLSGLGESYSNLIENSFVSANAYPETSFSLSVDKASYSNIRRFLMNEMKVPVDAVRIEEMLNYFNLGAADFNNDNKNFRLTTDVTDCPWNNEHKLMFVNIAAPKLTLDELPSSNLVFLIDVSGSMDKPNRLPIVQSGLKMLAEHLREKDTISIMTYGSGVAIRLFPTSGKEKERIKEVIDSLSANGDSPGEGAIRSAYTLAKQMFQKDGNNRIILATDGDFNVGQTSDTELEDLIITYRNTGIYLTCLGVGMGNYKDSKLEVLAKKGNGNFAYLDNVFEAEKVLVKEFTQTLFAVANDAYINLSFNPAVVKEYRLIGFDNKQAALQDTSSGIEGGEVGSGHYGMAIFELVTIADPNADIKLADLFLQYKQPNSTQIISKQYTASCHAIAFEDAKPALRFASSVAMFGMLLKQSDYIKKQGYEDLLAIAESAATKDFPQQEFLTLIRKADKVYNPNKRKKR